MGQHYPIHILLMYSCNVSIGHDCIKKDSLPFDSDKLLEYHCAKSVQATKSRLHVLVWVKSLLVETNEYPLKWNEKGSNHFASSSSTDLFWWGEIPHAIVVKPPPTNYRGPTKKLWASSLNSISQTWWNFGQSWTKVHNYYNQ